MVLGYIGGVSPAARCSGVVLAASVGDVGCFVPIPLVHAQTGRFANLSHIAVKIARFV